MQFDNAISTAVTPLEIVQDLTASLKDEYDLGILFATHKDADVIQEIIAGIKQSSSIRNLLGCTCAGIIGSQTEIEHRPAVSLITAKLPQVKITPFVLKQVQLESLREKQEWYEFFEVYPNENPVFFAFPDPFQIDMNYFLTAINAAYPNAPVVGGLASAASQPNGNTLILNNELFEEGIVGAVLTGNINVETIVSQGCRPIGETYIITKAQENIIHELAGKPFIDILRKILDKASARDKLLAQEAIFLGLAINEYKDVYKRGDFLIRAVIGLDPNSGAGAVADYVRTGQTVQFHLRDAQTATEDLTELLKLQQLNNKSQKPKGALVFSCNGRGEYLFNEKNHDIRIIQNHLGPVPAAGFFCAGEIGPIGGKNFLHGFTDSMALFYPKH